MWGWPSRFRDDILDVTSDTGRHLENLLAVMRKITKTTYVTIRGTCTSPKGCRRDICKRALEGVASLSEKNVFLNELIRYLMSQKKIEGYKMVLDRDQSGE